MMMFNNVVIPRKDRVFIVEGTFEYDGHMFSYPNAKERKMSLFCTKNYDGGVVVTVRDEDLMKRFKEKFEGKITETMNFNHAVGFGMYSESNDEIELIINEVNHVIQ